MSGIPAWHSQALCSKGYDPEMWWYDYPRDGDAQIAEAYRISEAIKICNACPVQDLCLKEGLSDEDMQWGIRGGLLASERVKIVGKERVNPNLMIAERALGPRVRYILKHGKLPKKVLRRINKEARS